MEFEDLYQEIILDHYRKPRNLCENGNEHTGNICVTHENPLCGDELSLQVKMDENNTIKDICYKARGCSISTSSASMMTEAVKGLDKERAMQLIETVRRMMHGEPVGDGLGDIEALQGVASFPVRIKCVLLAWMALKDALQSVTQSAETGYDYN